MTRPPEASRVHSAAPSDTGAETHDDIRWGSQQEAHSAVRRPRLRTRTLTAIAATASAAVLAGCAGSAGSTGEASAPSGPGAGYAYGADQATVDAALEGLDPITITYQPTAASAESVMAPGGTVLAEEIE